jgi:SAM-dependent methyltransferase
MIRTELLHNPSVADEQAISAAALSAMRTTAAVPVCPLCGSFVTKRALEDGSCELRVCEICELFFIHPYPQSGAQHKHVKSGKYQEIELLDCARRYEGERLYYDRHFALIAEECEGASSLLDVGCGTGHMLERFARNPRLHRAGIELNPQAARFARRVSGCEIFETPLERFRSDRKYDVITMINVFSHIPSFEGMFRSLRAALAPGGKLILRTSEMARNVSRWNQAHWGIPDDLHFLGLGTLDFLCSRYGFGVTRHLRIPFEEELFLRSRWEQMGRSPWLNLAKRVGVCVPGALGALKRLYTKGLGQRLFISLIALKRLPDCEGLPDGHRRFGRS